jgi:hypothetical protein
MVKERVRMGDLDGSERHLKVAGVILSEDQHCLFSETCVHLQGAGQFCRPFVSRSTASLPQPLTACPSTACGLRSSQAAAASSLKLPYLSELTFDFSFAFGFDFSFDFSFDIFWNLCECLSVPTFPTHKLFILCQSRTS